MYLLKNKRTQPSELCVLKQFKTLSYESYCVPNSLMRHQETSEHCSKLEIGLSCVKLETSSIVKNEYFHKEWKDNYPWVTVDPSGTGRSLES